MNSLANSLRCLKHPTTLFSIGLLLVNDHVLKVTVPSWLTGKLSDFAGLFFFPFVLAAALSIITDRLRISPRQTGWLVFGITAVWFVAMKTTVWGNALTEDLVAHLLGVPARIVLDPTDLIALPVLIPAWRLWNHVEDVRPSRWDWIALGVASLATLATSPLPPIPVIKHVGSQGGPVYASGDLPRESAMSFTAGRTWTSNLGENLADHKVVMPFIVCDSSNSKICYRIGKTEEVVEESSDGGGTWHVAWSIPVGRRAYMQRHLCGIFGCRKSLDLGPYDMTLAGSIGPNGLHTLVVALGNEGVLVRTPEGSWERYAVMGAEPTPFTADDPISALFDVLLEIIIWLILGVIAAFTLFRTYL